MEVKTNATSDTPVLLNVMPSTLIELLSEKSQRHPLRVAYTFLADGETEESSLTYEGLEKQAQAIAAWLQLLNVGGERVLLLYPPGLEYIAAFFGCLYAGAVAVPAFPPGRNQSLLRVQSIVTDSAPVLVLTTSAILSKAEALCNHLPSLETVRWMATDSVKRELATEWRNPTVESDTLAFLQYTSGSTAAPKGVMVTHGNLLHNQTLIQTAFQQTEQSVVVGWLPLYHDMGLIGNVIQPLYLGARCVLMSPQAFLQRPLRWLKAISHYRATTSGGPNFAYDLCTRKIKPEEKELLDLSSWSVAFNGAEPIRAASLDSFAAVFASCGFRREAFHPCYGMAEATLLISGGQKNSSPTVKAFQTSALEGHRVVETHAASEDAQHLVGCGGTLREQKIIIVNTESLAVCAPDEVGEIWVSGPSVAQGYWNQPDETEKTFQAYPANTGEGPFLRTGDLGFMLDGELFVTGRVKDLIIIRGFNHYPQDIEFTVEKSHAALRAGGGAAFSIEIAGKERLVVLHEVIHRRLPERTMVFEKIREAVAMSHEIDVYAIALIKPRSLPRTSSGKLQRRACREKFIAGKLEIIEEWHASVTPEGFSATVLAPASLSVEVVEAWLRAQLAARRGEAVDEIDAHQPFSRYALDSLASLELVHALEASLGVTLPLAVVLQSASLYDLAAQAVEASTLSASFPQPTRVSSQTAATTYALSYGQRAMYFLSQLAPESPAYNIASAMRVCMKLDIDALQRTCQALVNRHPA
ncbi:MAG TPA: AMP-binding protein, partial [Pyrinomonadaceae bacterium]|nr:AMP-binding protein [Pyrinomonadaceae bacterium]